MTVFRARPLAAATIVAAVLASACHGRAAQVRVDPPAPPPSIALIGEVKAFEEVLGGAQTDNFRMSSTRATSDERCYFTGKLQLPEYYSGLRMVREDEARCTARSDEADVFFYAIQAVASGQETITVALAEAPLERVLVVVPHEDFHNQLEALKAPTEVAEAASTLVGFVTAAAFAKEKYGAASPMFELLDRDAGLFLKKSEIVNTYFDRLNALYESLRAGELTREETLERKAALFGELERACSAIAPDPASFNKCPAAMNNAGLAFDRTYTRNYPRLHELYLSLGKDTSALVPALKQLLPTWPSASSRAADPVE